MFEKIAAGVPNITPKALSGMVGSDNVLMKLLNRLKRFGLADDAANLGLVEAGKASTHAEKSLRPMVQELAERSPSDLERAFTADLGATYKRPAALGATVGGGAGALTDTSEEKENPVFGTSRKVPGTWSDRIRNIATGAGAGALLGVGARAAKFKGSQNPLLQKVLEDPKGAAALSSDELWSLAKDLPSSKLTGLADELNQMISPGGSLAGGLGKDILSPGQKKDMFDKLYKANVAPHVAGLSQQNQGLVNWSPAGVSWWDRLLNRGKLRDTYTAAESMAAMPELGTHLGLQPGMSTRSTLLNRFKTRTAPADVYTHLVDLDKRVAAGKVPITEKLLLELEDLPKIRQIEDVAAKAMDRINTRIRVPRVFGRMFGADESIGMMDQLMSNPDAKDLIIEGLNSGRLGPATKALIQEAISKGYRLV